MVLESTMICLDNSEWMRNGDYIPTRLDAQQDAANLLCGAKTQANPESTVGILTMAGRGVEVLVSPTEDLGKLLGAVHGISISGNLKFLNALQVAQLALKHRRNKKGSQRIIAFVSSPLQEDKATLVRIAKLLKKNNVAVDVVSMGEIDVNNEKLQAFVEGVDSNNNSHLVSIPVGALPSDVLVSSPVVHGGEGMSGAGGAGNYNEFGGIDPTLDPELALALRVSMEEERARQEAAARKAAEESGKQPADASAVGAAEEKPTSTQPAAAPAPPSMPMDLGDDEDAQMAWALQMSLQDGQSAQPMPPSPPARSEPKPASPKRTTTQPASPKAPAKAPAPAPAEAKPQAFLDPSFVSSLLSGLQGVDPNDPRIQAAMAQLGQQSKRDDKKSDSKDDKDAKK